MFPRTEDSNKVSDKPENCNAIFNKELRNPKLLSFNTCNIMER